MKYQRFTTLGSKDIGIIKLEFVANTQFLWNLQINYNDIQRLTDLYLEPQHGQDNQIQLQSDQLNYKSPRPTN